MAARYHALFPAAGLAEAGPYPVHGVVLPHEVPGSRHVWHQYVIRTARRDELREFLAARKIGSEIYYPVPLHMQDALKSLGYAEGSFPEAERAAREVLALPIFPELREDEQQTVVGGDCGVFELTGLIGPQPPKGGSSASSLVFELFKSAVLL